MTKKNSTFYELLGCGRFCSKDELGVLLAELAVQKSLHPVPSFWHMLGI